MAERARRREDEARLQSQSAQAVPASGLRIERFFTTPGEDPYDTVEWELRSAVIQGEGGEIVFEQ